MMTRTQLSLDSEALRRARSKAAQLGISLAEYFRRLLSRDLGEPAPSADPSRIFDLGDSGGSNIARDKDRMIGEAFHAIAEAKRKRRSR
jgi:hypothetical protein